MKMPSTSLFRRDIDRDPPAREESVVAEHNLLKRFVDEGDLLLGRALETEAGRKLYERIRNYIFVGAQLSTLYNYCVYLDTSETSAWSLVERADDDKILVLKMIEKAVADFGQKQLLLQS